MIPQSQEVKQFIKEPSYSTMLQLQREGASATAASVPLANKALMATTANAAAENTPPPIYANYREGLKSRDSHGSGEEELLSIAMAAAAAAAPASSPYNSPPSPVSSSYSELRQATKYPPGKCEPVNEQSSGNLRLTSRVLLLRLPFANVFTTTKTTGNGRGWWSGHVRVFIRAHPEPRVRLR